MSNILQIDYRSKTAPEDFVKSLSSTGFAVINNHDIDANLILETYNDWKKFFSLEEKHSYRFDDLKQDGYFPFKSENAKGYHTKDLKEFFHIYRWGKYPCEISDATKKMHHTLLALGTVLLDYLDDYAPASTRKKFSMKLSEMINGSGQNLLRVIHYPPVETKDTLEGAIRAAAHTDINLITILIAEPGLQVIDESGDWVDINLPENSIVINIGDMLQEASGGFYKSTIHRVINPKLENNRSRYSIPLFIHPKDNVKLSGRFTAKEYLEKRLKEIGLK